MFASRSLFTQVTVGAGDLRARVARVGEDSFAAEALGDAIPAHVAHRGAEGASPTHPLVRLFRRPRSLREHDPLDLQAAGDGFVSKNLTLHAKRVLYVHDEVLAKVLGCDASRIAKREASGALG